MTDIYLALGGSLNNISTGFDQGPAAAALCSYVYYDTFAPLLNGQQPATVPPRFWVLDSGAYTAFMSGKPIQLQDYIDFCKRLQDTPAPPKEIYALDVIGDWRATVQNVAEMHRQGVPAIPCYHVGEPLGLLKDYAAAYPKVAIGGAAGRLFGDQRFKYLEQVFAHVWPKRMHAFGVTTRDILFRLPFHSADATSWQLGALRFGTWEAYDLPVAGTRKNHYLRPEVKVFLDMEARLKVRWRKEMKELENGT